MNYETFCQHVAISPETYRRLQAYHDLLLKWQSRVNLISSTTIQQIWERHILDSAELLSCLESKKENQTIADIGAGAGFPGLVLAICGAGEITLIESDRKKCEFLREAARVTGATVSILNERAEAVKDRVFDIIVSRATAKLETLFEWSLPLMHPGSFCLFHKGENWATEVEAAHAHWLFDVEALHAKPSSTGCIIKATNLLKRPR